jgi:hypothetical protein
MTCLRFIAQSFYRAFSESHCDRRRQTQIRDVGQTAVSRLTLLGPLVFAHAGIRHTMLPDDDRFEYAFTNVGVRMSFEGQDSTGIKPFGRACSLLSRETLTTFVINISGTFYYLCSILEGCSRYM